MIRDDLILILMLYLAKLRSLDCIISAEENSLSHNHFCRSSIQALTSKFEKSQVFEFAEYKLSYKI